MLHPNESGPYGGGPGREMPAVPVEATEQAQGLGLSRERTAVQLGPSPKGSHDMWSPSILWWW